jgi:hypothetical protein
MRDLCPVELLERLGCEDEHVWDRKAGGVQVEDRVPQELPPAVQSKPAAVMPSGE